MSEGLFPNIVFRLYSIFSSNSSHLVTCSTAPSASRPLRGCDRYLFSRELGREGEARVASEASAGGLQATTPVVNGAAPAGSCQWRAATVGRLSSLRLKQVLMLALAVLVSAAMLVWLVTDPVFEAVLDLLHRLRFEPLLLAVALVAPLQWLRGWRFALLLQRQPDLPDWRHFKLAAQLSFLNMALPFKVGDFSFPLLARRTVAADLLPATVAIVWCRLSDLCVVAGMLLLAGAWLITPEGHGAYRLATAALGLVCLLLPLALVPLSSLLRAARRFRPLLRLLPASAPMRCRERRVARAHRGDLGDPQPDRLPRRPGGRRRRLADRRDLRRRRQQSRLRAAGHRRCRSRAVAGGVDRGAPPDRRELADLAGDRAVDLWLHPGGGDRRPPPRPWPGSRGL